MDTPYLFPIDPNEFFEKQKQLFETVLKNISQQAAAAVSFPQQGLTEKPLLSLLEICKLFQITKPTVYDWIEHHKLKPYKIRGKVYFLSGDIKQLIADSNTSSVN
jgi:excisionase family DNA binding protein